jgi:flagellar motor switch protein FliG
MESSNLPGALKAAVLIGSIRKETQDQVLSMLSQDEKELIIKNLEQVGNVSSDVIEKISEEFTFIFDQKSKMGVSDDLGIKDVSGKKKNIKNGNLEAVQSIDPEQLIGFIKDEHPQTIAVIVAHLKPKNASKILSMLPEEIQQEVAVRIAELDKVMTGMVNEIDDVFEDILANVESSDTHKTGGVEKLAEILNQADESTLEQVMNAIEEVNEDLVAQIKQRMFIFDDLVLVEDRGMQQVLRKVDTKELSLALKAASEEVREKVMRNMSERAGQILMEEIETLGAIKMKDVEVAQQKITDIIQKMEADGELAIIRKGGGDYVE